MVDVVSDSCALFETLLMSADEQKVISRRWRPTHLCLAVEMSR